MDCLLCKNTFDETTEIPDGIDENGKAVNGTPNEEQKFAALHARRSKAKTQNAWRQIVVMLDEGNKLAENKHLVHGHICPGHEGLKPGDVKLSLVKDGVK